ncbi:prepilin-type N-terminal cleavage/methylation domain-containing protein [Salmonella enterica]|nr:prepilin-type N-terminal cleavage/methylation domain-containing protein [Salmonella enterica]
MSITTRGFSLLEVVLAVMIHQRYDKNRERTEENGI